MSHAQELAAREGPRRSPAQHDAPPTRRWAGRRRRNREDQASSVSSVRLRVRLTSTGMPGPMVVDTVIFVM